MIPLVKPSVLAFALCFAVSYALTAALTPTLKRLKLGQVIRNQGPRAHLAKAGTPTMGGLAFLGAFGAVFLPLALASNSSRIAAFSFAAAVLGLGAIGFADDFLKTASRRPLGIKARHKLLLQVVVAVALATVAPALRGPGPVARTPTWIDLPFFPGEAGGFDLGHAYTGFAALTVIAAANAANLTDGLDGLLAGAGAISYLAFWFICTLSNRAVLALGCACMAGSLAGFLPHNAYPARVFMGDTGSLAVGGGLAAAALFTGTEGYLPLIGGVLVVETASVILQVLSYRLFGRRVFRMSPLHHHFELGGWAEKRVVATFWLAAAIFGLAGVLGYVTKF